MSPAVIQLLLQIGAPLVAQYGIPALVQLFSMFTPPTGAPAGTLALPTQAQWDALIALSAKTARTVVMERLAANNVDPASPLGVAMLAGTPV